MLAKEPSKFQKDNSFKSDKNSTISKPVERSPVKNNLLMFLIISSGFYYGYYDSIFGPLGLKVFHLRFNIPLKEAEDMITYLQVSFPIGALLGCTTTSFQLNNVGRMKMLLLNELMSIYTQIMYSTGNIYCIFIARFISGAIASLIPSLAVITALELLPKRLGNPSGNFFAFCCDSGFATSSIVGYFFHNEFFHELDPLTRNYEFAQLWPGVISVLRVCGLLYFKFETPKFYLMKYGVKDTKPQVKKALKQIYADEKSIEIVADQIVNEHTLLTLKKKDVVFQDLFKTEYRRRFAAGILVNMGQQLVGINFFAFYGVIIFDKVTANGAYMNFILQFCSIFGSQLSIQTLQKFGRRFNFLVGIAGNATSYVILAFGFYYENKYLLASAVIFFIISFSIGQGSTIYVYQAEILPPVGVGAVCCTQWIACILVSGFTPYLVNTFGLINVSIGFCVTCLILFILVDFICLETSGKSEVQIADEFRKSEYRSSISSVRNIYYLFCKRYL